jgi:vancomycin resistance protein YoaR
MTTALEPTIVEEPTEPVVPTVRASRRLTRFILAFLLGLVAFLVLGASALYAYDQQYLGRVLPGVHVGDVDLSGLSADQARAVLHQRFDSIGTGTIILAAGDNRISLPFSAAGRAPDVDAMVGQAMAIGRAGNVVERVIANTRTVVRGVVVEPQVTFDADELRQIVAGMAAAQHVAPADASVAATKTGYTVTAAVVGRSADPNPALVSLATALGRVDAPSTITADLPVTAIEPTITTDEARAAVDAASRMVADVRIVDGTDSWTITAATVRSWLTFQGSADGTERAVVDLVRVAKSLSAVAKDANRPARNAGFELKNGRVVVSVPSRAGRALDAVATAANVGALLSARATGAVTGVVDAAVKAAAPALTTDQAAGFAPKMRMISSFSVFYWVIVNNHWGGNIEAPATKINGTVVPAGGVFDFWQVVGDLHKLPGTGPGNAIEGGKITVTGAFGGGICTTSTTLFNAAFRAGMIPLARQNHNEFIDRYPPGLDATVWIVGNTKQTMSFKNDTAYPILITRTIRYDGSKRWLTFKIWSVPNGRTAKVTNLVIKRGPRATNKIVLDPTKPVGYTFFNNAAVDGAKVWVTVTIYDHGKIHWSNRYYSNYPAVTGVVIKGTKT